MGGLFDFDPPHIFVGGAMSPMNIRGLYLLVTWLHRRMYGGSGLTGTTPYICWLINKYRWYLIHFKPAPHSTRALQSFRAVPPHVSSAAAAARAS
jgi:hypothetical protein